MALKCASASRRSRAGVDYYEAFRKLVLRAGVPELAPLMGLKPGTLWNKADAADDSHAQPTMRDVVLATQATGDMSVLDALEQLFGRAAFDCGRFESASDEALLELLANLGRENGEFHAALSDALRAGRFTLQKLQRIRAEAFDCVSALMVLVGRLEGLLDDEDDVRGDRG